MEKNNIKKLVEIATDLVNEVVFDSFTIMDGYNEFPIAIGFRPENMDIDSKLTKLEKITSFTSFSREKRKEIKNETLLETPTWDDDDILYYDTGSMVETINEAIMLIVSDNEKGVEHLYRLCYSIKNA